MLNLDRLRFQDDATGCRLGVVDGLPRFQVAPEWDAAAGRIAWALTDGAVGRVVYRGVLGVAQAAAARQVTEEGYAMTAGRPANGRAAYYWLA